MVHYIVKIQGEAAKPEDDHDFGPDLDSAGSYAKQFSARTPGVTASVYCREGEANFRLVVVYENGTVVR